MDKLQFTTHNETETHRLGERLGGRLRAGDVMLLTGELGAGKSVLARGVARGMGITGPLPSPTFTLMTQHQGPACPLYHMDWYRLNDADELFAAGLSEYVGGDGVALIEWPQRAPEAVPARHLAAEIAYGAEDDERQITLTIHGGFPPEDLQGLEEETR